MQDIELYILHLYTLDLSTKRFLRGLRNSCENMQATTALAGRRSFPPSWRWVSTRGPPTCVEPAAGSWTAPPNSGTCPAPISPPVWRRRCLFIGQVRRERLSTWLLPVMTCYCLFLLIGDIIAQTFPKTGSSGIPDEPVLSSTSTIASQMSTRRERGTGQC